MPEAPDRTAVEVVDGHNGFEVITKRIRTSNMSLLMRLIGIASAIVDNVPLAAASTGCAAWRSTGYSIEVPRSGWAACRQSTLPKMRRTTNEGMQNPVLTFTKAAATNDQPTTWPSRGMPA